jgi:hypothetical protein
MNIEILIKHLATLQLSEAGKVLSKDSEKSIRAALEALQSLLDKIAPAAENNVAKSAVQESAMRDELKVLVESFHGQLIEAEVSHDQIRSALYDALRAHRYRADGSYVYRYIVEVYDGWFVYREEGQDNIDRLFKCEYSLDAANKATLGESEEVRLEISYVPIASVTSESAEQSIDGDFIPLIEKAVGKNGRAKIKVISPGWNKSKDIYYPEDVLKRDIAAAFPKGTHMGWDHMTEAQREEQPEGKLDNLAAVFAENAYYDENGPKGPGGYAEVEIKEHYRDKVETLAPDIGTSIFAWGRGTNGEAEGHSGRIIQSLIPDDFNQVDFVTRPGAGGEVLQLFESARRSPKLRAENPQDKKPKVVSESQPQNPPAPSGPAHTGPNSQEEIPVTEAEIKDMQDKLAALEGENQSLREASGRTSEALLLMQARTLVTETLSNIEMPEPTRKRLCETLSAAPVTADNGTLDRDATKTKVEEAAQAELDYLATLTESGAIRGMNSNATRVNESESDEPSEEDIKEQELLEAQLAGSLQGIGLSETAAKAGARGR